MPYNTKNVLKDAGNKPIPQVFDKTLDDFRPSGIQGVANSIVVGKKTVGAVQVELCAGANRLANRVRMRLFCQGDDNVHVGPDGVTVDDGYPILPGKEKIIKFEQDADVAVYGIAASDQVVWIMEEA